MVVFVEKELPQVLLDDSIMQVLKFSYDDLPSAIKHCFAYCSLFPKHHVFDKDALVRMWLAQGLLKPHPEKSLEEVGDAYFFHLIDRCFFQEVKMDTKEGCVRYTCKMHDLLHDLAIQVAGMESKCFLYNDSGDRVERSSTLRHMSVQCDPKFLLEECGISSYTKTVRSLLFHDQTARLITKSLNSFFTSMRMLRGLQLSSLEVEALPDSLGELIHLRYLDLSRNPNLKGLPYSICKLHHLQTLILKGCSKMKELPSSLGKLVSLRHLLLDGCDILESLPSGLAGLAPLVTLDRLVVHHCHGGLRYLGSLDSLSGSVNIELPAKGWSDCIEDARKSNMSKKLKLNGMVISWSGGDTNAIEEDRTMAAVLEEFEPPKCIQYLKIKRHGANALSSWFSSLMNLKQLHLVKCRIEYIDVSVRGGSSLFPCLEILKIEDLPNLKGWCREVDNAPMSVLPVLHRVSNVAILDCPNLVESMPLFVRVKTLKLYSVDGKLVRMLLTAPTKCCSFECHPYNNLEELDLSQIKELECLPEGLIRQLTALRSLSISSCTELRWVSCRGLGYLTSLEELQIWHCGNVGLEDKDYKKALEMSNELGMPWKALQRLHRVENMPWQSHLQVGLQYLTSLEELGIHYFEDKQVEADNALDIEGRGLLWNGLERLHELMLDFHEIRCDFPCWIQHLRFVKDLRLNCCEELRGMSWSILANMQLEILTFCKVKKVMRVDDSVAEQPSQPSSLFQLVIFDSEDGQWVRDIPWSLLPSLRILRLRRIENLSGIPDGIQHLTSLQQLEIWVCSGIKEIPNWMINLKSLQRLEIWGCSAEVEERCKPETGADWHLISHIPHKYII